MNETSLGWDRADCGNSERAARRSVEDSVLDVER